MPQEPPHEVPQPGTPDHGSPDHGEHRPARGTRIRLVSTTDPHTRLVPGTLGTVLVTDALGTIHVGWDDGSSLGLVPGLDQFELVDQDPPAPTPTSPDHTFDAADATHEGPEPR